MVPLWATRRNAEKSDVLFIECIYMFYMDLKTCCIIFLTHSNNWDGVHTEYLNIIQVNLHLWSVESM